MRKHTNNLRFLRGILWRTEQREVDAAVGAVLYEARHIREIVMLAVLEDEQTAGAQHALAKDELRYGGQRGQSVRRVGEDEVVLLLARLDEAEHVATDEDVVLRAELRHALADERRMVAVHLHAHNRSAAAREQFERDAARTSEEIERLCAIHIDVAVNHVEDILFGEVRCRTSLERARNIKVAPFIFSCYYTHNMMLRWCYGEVVRCVV